MKRKILIGGLCCVALAVGGIVWLYVAFFVSMERGDEHRRQFQADLDSGHWNFGDQPALFAVAQAIVKNDQEAIRAGGRAVPDIQAPGRDGMTLLYFAVTQSWRRPELVEAIKTLLSLGADPNYTNGQRDSFAMASAIHGSAPLLRSMLDAGGNPNTRDEFGQPIILMNWYLGTTHRTHGPGSICCSIAGRTSTPPCRQNAPNPVTHFCSTAQNRDRTIMRHTPMRCIRSSAALTRTVSLLTG